MLSSLTSDSSIMECAGQCSAVRTVSFREFRRKVRGTSYRELIEFHLRRHPPREVRGALAEVLGVLPGGADEVAAELAGRWSDRLREGGPWEEDCAEVADRIADEARELLEERGTAAGDDVLFDLFEVVTLNFARAAHEHESVRQAIGISRRGWLARHWWALVGGAACLGVSVLVGPLWLQALLWAAGGSLMLAPAARWVDEELSLD